MRANFTKQIEDALGDRLPAGPQVTETATGELHSCFATSDLAVATLGSAASELAAFLGTGAAVLNRRLALLWFKKTLRPIGWELRSTWDAVAGDYQTADGWIRLHTNAPHHRDAALSVLGCPADRAAVAKAVQDWQKVALQEAVVGAGGAAAAMHDLATWSTHPQGSAVAAEPLIDWQTTATDRPPLVLEGLRVLDLTRVLAGPVATRFLAGFGAQVLRIDPPSWNEPAVEPEVTLGKRRAGLDLTKSDDRHVFENLLRNADVLVHGYRADAMERLGYGHAERRRIAPNLIDVSLNAFGWTGPWATRRGFDSLVQMSSGIAAEGMRRAGADRPVPLPVQALDHGTGYLMAAAVLRALRLRRATGESVSARLSLARTAAMLTGAGAGDFHGAPISEDASDLAPEIEMTGWGPARRLAFPVQIDGRPPHWAIPAGPLRIDPPGW
ncbi:MAG: acyl-CoA transferase [Paracoccus denitrificans]|uniref:Acyl-CoA transferase n=1 Tax=Paracoccus denitrificans TaxID=266 RepID=A0A533I791_PARDE|nr:MAG: acyl-CoA transferase [Paracoccus denitrificans]